MAKAMTAATRPYSEDLREDSRPAAEREQLRRETPSVSFLVAKNLLFWGSVVASLYAVYLVVTAI